MAIRSVIIDFDFAVLDGANILYRVTQEFLAKLDRIPFDDRIEAQYFAGCEYLAAFTRYFPVVKTKKTALKASKDLPAAFRLALNQTSPEDVSNAFRLFLKALEEKDVNVWLVTRGDIPKMAEVLAPLMSDRVRLHHENATTYGGLSATVWRRLCKANQLVPGTTVGITGSEQGVKAALFAGMPSLAVVSDHLSYQDFSGADAVVSELNSAATRKVLALLKAGGK